MKIKFQKKLKNDAISQIYDNPLKLHLEAN